MEPRAHGADRALRDRCGVGVTHLLQLTQHDRLSIRCGQRCDRRAHGLDGFRTRHGVEHRRLPVVGPRGPLVVLIELEGRDLATAQPLQDEVTRDAEQVIADACPWLASYRRLSAVDGTQHGEKRVLDDVVGGIAAAHVRRVAEDGALKAGKQPGEGDRIAAARQCNQPGIVHVI